jgi:cardiolipin synthase
LPVQTKSRTAPRKRSRDTFLAVEFKKSRALRVVAVIAIAAVASWIIAGLFAPGPRYSLPDNPAFSVDSDAFLNEVEPLVNSKLTRNNRIEVFPNGENFYEAELAAMRGAQRSINIEAYIFHKGEVARRVLEVLTDRARAGVKVNLVLDALGSLSTPKSYFDELRQAGGRVAWYHSLRWNNWFRSNNRTHREMTILDGSTAFVGGAGFADWWRFSQEGDPRWRDTMLRVHGDAVPRLQGVFIENWLEASGEILIGDRYFPPKNLADGSLPALVVASTPSSGGSTRARILFQTLIAGAHKTIYLTTPYFLPDRSLRQEMVDALHRGVRIKIVVPGKHNDHSLTRSSGRGTYGDLLKAGADIYEYEPSMIHAKILIVDGLWAVVGSTNFDSRSFGINDEVNFAVPAAEIAATLTQDFEADVSHSRHVTLEQWRNRSLYERALEWVGWLLENQQ